MKKLISLILSICLLLSFSSAVTVYKVESTSNIKAETPSDTEAETPSDTEVETPNNTEVEIPSNFKEAFNTVLDDATSVKIYKALATQGAKIAHEGGYGEETFMPDELKELHNITVVSTENKNYVLSFYSEMVCECAGGPRIVLGDYVILLENCGYGVYCESEDKIYSMGEAYEKGILTNEVMFDIWKTSKKDGYLFENFVTKIGDITRDGNIDIVDVALCRNAVINNFNFNYGEGSVNTAYADMNSDGKIDILDIALMRNYIING